jgi:serine/threonine-protein kinase HipA
VTDELIVLLQGREVGQIQRRARHRLSLLYSEAWRQAADAYPLSLSMPLAARQHGPDVVEPFLWNLLPDNEAVLARWGRQFGVSARNIFELLQHVGEDLAGAIQIVRPDRLAEVVGDGPEVVDWINDSDVAARLRALREDVAAWRLPRDTGQFSLAGAQPKTALIQREGHWGVPQGRTPTTHILKPPTGEWGAFAENEHFCLRLARRLGLPVATSNVQRFEDELAIVVERYDRLWVGGRIVRVHQEDLCQSLGVHPVNKYENEGGPGVRSAVELLRTYSSSPADDIQTFLDALALNWLIGGTDAHGKNFSVLLGSGGKTRLAPLYDIASRMAYDPWHPRELRLAMQIGGEYNLGHIHPPQWEKLAHQLRLGAADVWRRVLHFADVLPEALRMTGEEVQEQGLEDPILKRLVERATQRANREAGVLREALGAS